MPCVSAMWRTNSSTSLTTRGQVWRRAAFAGRSAVAARVPGEDGHVVQAKRLDRLLPAAGVFVAAMEQEQRLFAGPCRQPGAVEQLGAVGHRDRVFARHGWRDAPVVGIVWTSVMIRDLLA